MKAGTADWHSIVRVHNDTGYPFCAARVLDDLPAAPDPDALELRIDEIG
jgi:hypothetical protein